MKCQLTLITLSAWLFSTPMWAGHITKAQAQQRAQTFMQQRGATLAAEPAAASGLRKSAAADANIYVFNAERQKGFVVVSGDDRTPAVLGYTDTGTFDPDHLPDGLRGLLETYDQQIAMLDKMGIQAPASPADQLSPVRRSVAPLLPMNWNQGEPYNLLCPRYYNQDGTQGGLSATGCVATAVAQVIGYYRHPDQTTGLIPGKMQSWETDQGKKSVTLRNVPAGSVIDWDNILDNYNGSETQAQKTAIAQLMYWVALAYKMDFGPSSGSGYGNGIQTMDRCFGFKKGAYVAARGNYTIKGWHDLIYGEIVNGHPVAFGGQNSGGGHAFVLDGYDVDGLFHCNWGWGGGSNGWFRIEVLAPGDNSGIGASPTLDAYNMGNEAIIGLRLPDDDGPGPDESGRLPEGYQVAQKMEVTDVTFLGNRKTGDDQKVSVTVRNLGEEFFREMHLYASLTQTKGSTRGRTAVNIPKGGEKTIVLNFKPDQAGTYNLWLCMDWYGNEVVKDTTMVITDEGIATSQNLRYVRHTLTNRQSGNVYGNIFQGQVTVLNQAKETYDGTLKLWLAKEGWMDKSLFVPIKVEPGKTATVDYSFDGLDYGKYYAMSIIYGEAGGDIVDGGLRDMGRPQPGVLYWTADKKISGMAPGGIVSVPASAVAVDVSQVPTIVKTLRTNNNPNTLYVINKSGNVPNGLDGANVVRGIACERLQLTDGYAFYAPLTFTASEASFKRAPNRTAWETVALPFVPEQIPTGVSLMALSGEDKSGRLHFSTASAMTANEPYLLQTAGTDSVSFTARDVTIDASGEQAMVLGTDSYRFEGTTVSQMVPTAYVLNDEATAFRPVGTTEKVAAFRAFVRSAVDTADEIPVVLDVVDAIRVSGASPLVGEEYFDLQGRRLDGRPAKGVYIRGGKKYVVR